MFAVIQKASFLFIYDILLHIQTIFSNLPSQKCILHARPVRRNARRNRTARALRASLLRKQTKTVKNSSRRAVYQFAILDFFHLKRLREISTYYFFKFLLLFYKICTFSTQFACVCFLVFHNNSTNSTRESNSKLHRYPICCRERKSIHRSFAHKFCQLKFLSAYHLL